MRVHPARGKPTIRDIGSLVYVGEQIDSWIITPTRLFKVDRDGTLLPITIRHGQGKMLKVRGLDLVCDPSTLVPNSPVESAGIVPTPATNVTHRHDVYVLNTACSPETSCRLVIERATKRFHWEIPDGYKESHCADQLSAFLDSIEITPCH